MISYHPPPQKKIHPKWAFALFWKLSLSLFVHDESNHSGELLMQPYYRCRECTEEDSIHHSIGSWSWHWGLWRDRDSLKLFAQRSVWFCSRWRDASFQLGSGCAVLCTIWKLCHVASVGPEPLIILALAWSTTRILFFRQAHCHRRRVFTGFVAYRASGLIRPALKTASGHEAIEMQLHSIIYFYFVASLL